MVGIEYGQCTPLIWNQNEDGIKIKYNIFMQLHVTAILKICFQTSTTFSLINTVDITT
jgi:hypothetical protein